MNETMDLLNTDIQYALAVKESGSVTTAALKVGIQQAGLSRAIQRLEEKLGEKIFFRDARGMRATEFGLRFLRAAQEKQEKWQQTLADLRAQDSKLRGRVRLGCHLALSLNYLPPIISKFNSEHPDLSLDLQIAPSQQVCEMVARGDLEFGLAVNATALPRLVLLRLRNEETALFSSQSGKTWPLIYFNPEMFSIGKLLKPYLQTQSVSLPSYDLIARTLLQSPSAAGLLPSGVAERYPLLKKVSPTLEKLPLSLVYREDLPKNKMNQMVIDKFRGLRE